MHFRHIFHGRRFARHAEGWDSDRSGDRHREHGRESGREHGRHRRHGGGRVFDYGELRLVLLALIAERPWHGYELIKEIEDRVGGGYSPSPGVIYPTLTQLEDLGYAAIEPAEAGRKQYAITDAGRDYLAAQSVAVAAAFARMAEAKADRSGDRSPQIVRAVENLKMALRLRLDRRPVSAADLDTIAAMLDAAAASIEKS